MRARDNDAKATWLGFVLARIQLVYLSGQIIITIKDTAARL
jgi:hypothetical protein